MNKPEDFEIENGVLIKYKGNDTEVVIPDRVTSIGGHAFSCCTSLTDITIHDNVTSIEWSAFSYCTRLTSITIPASVTSIGRSAFECCTSLANITIPDSVTVLGQRAFNGCDNAMIIYNSSYIRYWSFVNLSSDEYKGKCYFSRIPTKDIPKQLKRAAVCGFAEMYSQTELPQDLIADYASYLKRQRKKYYAGIESDKPLLKFMIDKRIIAFEEIDGIVDSVENTEVKALLIEYKNSFDEKEAEKLAKKKDDEFDKMLGLKELTLKDYKNFYGMEFVKSDDGYILKKYRGKDKNVLIFGEVKKIKVTGIGEKAFYGCAGIEKVVIPEGIKSIGESAFSGCEKLASITIPGNATSIGRYAFDECTSLTYITIPDSVTSIGHGAFCECTSLTGITIPDSVKSIGDYAFSGCRSLTSIIIPDSVTNIGNNAFGGCTSLADITIPDSVTCIEWSAFIDCTSLADITIPDSVTSIGDGAFKDCTSLTSITIPDCVTSICSWVFSNCIGLKSITIPDSVASIGYSAFYDCTNLTIKCTENSYAHKYAIENNIKFELIEK